ncbi:MAG: hypothetical protein UX09_C0067G0005 [Candidatus Uhrbacteria bacterium GW2011_GWE2_45_35]|uniref:Uncharacterized protein n=1 Tax=Candidatus Uhrbacteria bacterium GW2011_GWE2_45_35 TaxID=1618993 RepID=A0A0G1PJR5_9BACT|nr:MAG: hypothetical protein UX09_C0067G0005 [Candidatus Uhrbacteria bacterium GW2011_GWE2_45_35]HCU31760.1 hypothetical protein [Candidatus Uhrbacteria bacterium]
MAKPGLSGFFHTQDDLDAHQRLAQVTTSLPSRFLRTKFVFYKTRPLASFVLLGDEYGPHVETLHCNISTMPVFVPQHQLLPPPEDGMDITLPGYNW